MPFSGSCHCGAVAFTVDADLPAKAMSCNCSLCRRKGFLLAFFGPEQFTLDKGQEMLATYLFNRHTIEHQFCKTCGTEAFAHGKGPNGSRSYAVNLRCVEAIDLDTLDIAKVDGARF